MDFILVKFISQRVKFAVISHESHLHDKCDMELETSRDEI